MTESHDLSYFNSIPWCSSLISSPDYTVAVTRSRQPKPTTEDALFAETLKTNTTISACLSLYKNPTSNDQPIEEARRLLALGSGLNGWPDMCHGGITATILDEVMGHLLSLRMDREEEILRASGQTPVLRPISFTGELTVRFLRPIATPQTVCVVARVARIDGRKVWLEGVVEDQFGTPFVDGELRVHISEATKTVRVACQSSLGPGQVTVPPTLEYSYESSSSTSRLGLNTQPP